LRSRIVSEWMINDKPIDELNEYVNRVSKRKRWYKSNYPFNSFYTQCLTIAINSNNYPFTMLKLMSTIPPPNSINIYWNTISWLCAMSVMIPTSILVLYIQSKLSLGSSNIFKQDKLIFLILFMAVYSAAINVIMTRKMTTRAYISTMRFTNIMFSMFPTPYDNSPTLSLLRNVRGIFINHKLMAAVLEIRKIIFRIKENKELILSDSLEEP
jgi:hypothetical protein